MASRPSQSARRKARANTNGVITLDPTFAGSGTSERTGPQIFSAPGRDPRHKSEGVMRRVWFGVYHETNITLPFAIFREQAWAERWVLHVMGHPERFIIRGFWSDSGIAPCD
jgi:hypothetical protein